MAHEKEVQAVKKALAGNSAEAKLEAVLALPDGATDAVATLEAARGGDDLRLEVAILDALFRIQGTKNEQRLIDILDHPKAQGDAGEELYMMARIALNRMEKDDGDPVSAEGTAVSVFGAAPGRKTERLAVVVHGTWARDGKWWRPGGNFHEYLLKDLGLTHLYSGNKPFAWSGKNRNTARHNAAVALRDWVKPFKPKLLEVFGHSHGANVAMLATHRGLEIDRLVMMSPPVRKDYHARWQRVRAAYNIQVNFDPVVGVARGGRWFGRNSNPWSPEAGQPPKVLQVELPIGGHSNTHEPDVWKAHDLPAFVGLK